jgi:hypothetical protein
MGNRPILVSEENWGPWTYCPPSSQDVMGFAAQLKLSYETDCSGYQGF